jgi:hypothetical protein
MAASGKKGNVVLIEAFVVLCLLFMLQYVLAGIRDATEGISIPSFFSIDIGQVETANDQTNHFDFVQIDRFMLDMGGGANCPLPVDPRVYGIIEGKISQNAIPAPRQFQLDGVLKDNTLAIKDDAAFLIAKNGLSSKGITLERYRGQVGYNIVASGYLDDIKAGLFISLFSCECNLSASPNEVVGLDHPHPLILALTKVSIAESSSNEYVAYHHHEQRTGAGVPLSGLLFDNPAKSAPNAPIRRFDFFIDSHGKVESENLVLRKSQEVGR